MSEAVKAFLQSSCILLCEGLGVLVVLHAVLFVQLCNFWDKRVIRVRVCEQRAHRQEHLGAQKHDGEMGRENGALQACRARISEAMHSA